MHPRWLTRTVCDASELLVAEYSTPHCCLADEVSGRAEPTVLVKLMPLGHLPKVRAVIRATVLCPRNRGRPCRLRGRPGRLFLELRWTWHVSFPLYEVVVSYVRLVLAVRESNTTRTASLTSGLVVLPATESLGQGAHGPRGVDARNKGRLAVSGYAGRPDADSVLSQSAISETRFCYFCASLCALGTIEKRPRRAGIQSLLEPKCEGLLKHCSAN